MTINVALLTNDALIMGCDSIASVMTPMVDPFQHKWPTDDDGKFLTDEHGNHLIPIALTEIETVVTTVMSGVQKMFLIHKDPDIVAVTAGLAKLNNLTMAALGAEFARQQASKGRKFVNVKPVANQFLAFVRKHYADHYKGDPTPEAYRQGPEFLVGGYGRDDAFPSLYRIMVSENTVLEHFKAGEAGLSWNGQAGSVERIIRGYDSSLRKTIEERVEQLFDEHHRKMTDAVVRILSDTLKQLKAELPDKVNTSIPTRTKAELPWSDMKLDIDYGNMPLQNAIDFVSWLVLTQSGRAKFAKGLPTVGGRTHIGLVTKGDGFRLLGEPELEHRYTGFAHDL